MFITTRTSGKPDTTDFIGTTDTKSSLKDNDFSLQSAKFPEMHLQRFACNLEIEETITEFQKRIDRTINVPLT